MRSRDFFSPLNKNEKLLKNKIMFRYGLTWKQKIF